MSTKSTRQQYIISCLEERGQLSVEELSNALSISRTTIRKDLDYLEKKGQLTRFHGGARLSFNDNLSPLSEERSNSTKKAVAQKAVELINNDEVIFLGSGTTCVQIARYLKERPLKLTVVSNNLSVMTELAGTPGFTLLGTGGQVDHYEDFSVFHGDFVIQFLEKVLVQKAFLTADGVSLKHGYTTHNRNEYHLYETIRKISEQMIFAVEGRKFNKNSVLRLADMDSIDVVISDDSIPEEYLSYYKKNNKHIYIGSNKELW